MPKANVYNMAGKQVGEIDLSDAVILMGGFAMGPLAACVMEFIKNILNLILNGTMTAGVGELANFIMGCALTVERDRVAVVSPKRLAPFRSLMTSPHPGFPTDMQAQMLALATRACGTSVLTENVFENRFNHVPDLCRMGADVIVAGRTAIVRGVETLHGARVAAHDLRGGAALVLAALCAEGETLVEEAEHIDRGYESLETELNALGARVTREER